MRRYPARARRPTDFYIESQYFDHDTFVEMMLEDVPAEELHAALHCEEWGKEADEDLYLERQPLSDATYEEGQQEESSEEEGAESGPEDSKAGSEADDEERASEASWLCDDSGTDCDERSAGASEAESE
jgi:hypothetical protein